MSKKTPNDDDFDLFRQYVSDIKPLEHDKIEPKQTRLKPIPKQTRADEEQVLEDMFSDDYEPEEINAADSLFFARDGIQNKVIRKLKRGQFRISAELDLHGMSVKVAREQLAVFLRECMENNWRCVRIIHGKGRRSSQEGPILKQQIHNWLPQRDEVLAYCSTIPAHGGTGAVYVLLKSQTRSP
jgi:DNA-nicking Smr family endonuclease